VQGVLDVALLRGGEVVVEEDDVGFGRRGGSGDFFELATSDERGGVGTVAMLEDFADNFGAGALGERAEFR